MINWSVDISVLLLAGIAAAFLVSGWMSVLGFGRWPRKRRLARWFIWLTYLGAVVMIVVQCFVFSGMLSESVEPPKTILVLGARLNGAYPSLVLQNRLSLALKQYDQIPDARIVVCGGQGEDESVPEAVAMRDWLERRGVDEARIICEDQSANTYENIANALSLLNDDASFSGRVLIVTSDYHIYRSKYIAGRLGLEAEGVGSRLQLWLRPFAHTRETISILREWVLPQKE